MMKTMEKDALLGRDGSPGRAVLLNVKAGMPGLRVTAACRALAQFTEQHPHVVPADAAERRALTRWLQRNKYPLLALDTRTCGELADDPDISAAIADEQAMFDGERREFELVREAWLRNGIACLMIKSAGNRPSFPHTSDNIDVLVAPEQGRRARAVLRDLGYVELRNIEERKKFLFRRFRGGHSVLALHVHEHVGWMVSFLDEDVLLQRMRPAADDPAINVPSPEDAFMINLAHAFYENKLLRMNDIARARHALRVAGADFDWAYVRHTARQRGWLDGLAYVVLLFADLEQALFGSTRVPLEQRKALAEHLRTVGFAWKRWQRVRQGPPVDLPLDLNFVFCKVLYYRKILGDRGVPRRQRWLDVGTTLLDGIKERSGIRPQAGMIVTLSGPDGSGKTTHAKSLVGVFHRCEIGAGYYWSRGGSTGLIERLNRLRRRTMAARDDEDDLAPRQARLANPVLRLAWSWLVAGDQLAAYWWRAWLPARLGRVVVCDRYVYDTAVEMERSLPANAGWSALAIRGMLALAPRPGAGYVLELPRAVARERRPLSRQPADLEEQQQRYRMLAADYGLQVLANDGPFADCDDTLVLAAVMRYMASFETLGNALFVANPRQRNRPDPIWTAGRQQ